MMAGALAATTSQPEREWLLIGSADNAPAPPVSVLLSTGGAAAASERREEQPRRTAEAGEAGEGGR